MRKEIADLSVRFGADGTRGLQQDIARVSTALGKLKSASFSAIGGLGKIGMGLGVSALAGVGALTALAAANDDYVQKVALISSASGIQLEAMSRLAAAARRYGLDVDDLRGALTQFNGQLAEGAAGGSVAEDFAKIGISAQDLKDNLDDPLKLLLMVAKAQEGLVGAERTNVLSKLFGEDDAVKMSLFLNGLGSGAEEVADQIGKIDTAGAVVTAEDVKLSNEFSAAMGEIGDVFRGLSLEISRTVLPTITDLVEAFAGFMRNNKTLITGQIAGAWKRVGYAIGDVVRFFQHGERAIKGTWLEPLVRWMREIGEAGGTTLRAVGDLFDVLGGRKQSGEFPWMKDFAEGVQRMASHAVNAIDSLGGLGSDTVSSLIGYLGGLPDVIDSVESSWATLQLGFEYGLGSGFLAETGKLFRTLWDGAIGVRDALIDIANGQPVDPAFEWVQSAVTAFGDITSLSGEFLTTLVTVTRQVIEQFGGVRNELENIFGIDITQMAMWVAFAQFSGVANTVLIAGGIILGVMGSLAGSAVILGIALGVLIAKLAETWDWINAPVRGLEWAIDEMTGDAGRMRDFWAENKRRGDEFLAQRAKLAGMSVDDYAAKFGNIDNILPGTQQPAATPADVDILDLLRKAQAFTDGSALQSALAVQSNLADIGQIRGTGSDIADVTPAPTGVPVIVQLSPTGETETIYAPDQASADRLVELVNKAKRASATRTAPSYARP